MEEKKLIPGSDNAVVFDISSYFKPDPTEIEMSPRVTREKKTNRCRLHPFIWFVLMTVSFAAGWLSALHVMSSTAPPTLPSAVIGKGSNVTGFNGICRFTHAQFHGTVRVWSTDGVNFVSSVDIKTSLIGYRYISAYSYGNIEGDGDQACNKIGKVFNFFSKIPRWQVGRRCSTNRSERQQHFEDLSFCRQNAPGYFIDWKKSCHLHISQGRYTRTQFHMLCHRS